MKKLVVALVLVSGTASAQDMPIRTPDYYYQRVQPCYSCTGRPRYQGYSDNYVREFNQWHYGYRSYGRGYRRSWR